MQSDSGNKNALLPILAYCTSSILMTLSNKYALSRYNFHLNFLLCAIQSFACVLLLEWFNSLGLVKHRKFNWEDARKWFPVSLALVAMIYSGSKALQHMTIPFFTIFKNLSIIVVAYSEYFFIKGPKITVPILMSFLLMSFSSVVAAWPDISGTTDALEESPLLLKYGWMFVNCFCSAFYVVAMKFKMDKVRFRDFDTVFFNNLLSIPVLLFCSLLTERHALHQLLVEFGKVAPLPNEVELVGTRSPSDWVPMWLSVIVSSIFSFGISYCTSWCIRMTSSTTYSMVGALNKLPIAVFGMVAFKDRLNFFSVSGVIIAFSAGIVYSIAKTKSPGKEGVKSYIKLNSSVEPLSTMPSGTGSGMAPFDSSGSSMSQLYSAERFNNELHLPYHHSKK